MGGLAREGVKKAAKHQHTRLQPGLVVNGLITSDNHAAKMCLCVLLYKIAKTHTWKVAQLSFDPIDRVTKQERPVVSSWQDIGLPHRTYLWSSMYSLPDLIDTDVSKTHGVLNLTDAIMIARNCNLGQEHKNQMLRCARR